jgi:hypothetical protein
VLRRYTQALEGMKGRAPVFVPRVVRENGGYSTPGTVSPEDWLLFPALVSGFKRYLEFVPAGEGREEAVQRFSGAAEKLGPQLFGATP